jgi:hypothetical protein
MNKYERAIASTVEKIRKTVPTDLVDRFEASGGISRDLFHSFRPEKKGLTSAVDGSNAMVFDSGNFSIAAVRAGETGFEHGIRYSRTVTPLSVFMIGPDEVNPDFPLMFQEYFGMPPGTPLSNEDPSDAASVLRDTLEYHVALEQAQSLQKDSLLLLDGALRVTHASHDAVLQETIRSAQRREILIAAISKRTSATWGGGYPLLPSVAGLANRAGITAPWWIKVDDSTLDRHQFDQWRHGDYYIAKLHPHARMPLKVELPEGTPDTIAGSTFARLAGMADDRRIPGYPFPLLDAHRAVVIDSSVLDRIRQDIIRGCTGEGMNEHAFNQIFGDYHDEFRRY